MHGLHGRRDVRWIKGVCVATLMMLPVRGYGWCMFIWAGVSAAYGRPESKGDAAE